jgi:hypothetical protein
VAFFFTKATIFISLAILISPIFFLRFIRSQKPLRGFLIILLTIYTTYLLTQNSFQFKSQGQMVYLTLFSSLYVAVLFSLPYLLDRLLSHRLKGLYRSLVYPTSAVIIYYLNARFGLFDGVGHYYAFTVYGNRTLVQLQLISLFGIWGNIFIISWTASFLNDLWDKKII